MKPSATGDLFQALVEYSSDAIVLVDATGKILFLSQTSEKILGYSVQDRLGKSGFEFIHPDDVAAAEAAFAEALAHPRTPCVPASSGCGISSKTPRI